MLPSSIFIPDGGMELLPLDTMFVRPQPVEIDVGCGKGRFLIARARAHPTVNFIGLDRMFKRIRRIDAKLVRAGIENVRLVRLEGLHAIQHMLPEASVRAMYIFFPDPWPKRRHHRRRLFSDTFVDALASSLVQNGDVHIMTDYLEYFDVIKSVFNSSLRFESIPFPEFPQEERTDFELVFAKQNKPTGRCSYRRIR